MPAAAIDGRALARSIEADLKAQLAAASQKRPPALAVVLVGDDAASMIYVGRKAKACKRVGIDSIEHRLPADASQQDLLDLVAELNADDDIDGILVQLPLPAGMDESAIINAIHPDKDVDGFHPANLGRVMTGQPGLAPCTPSGILLLLAAAGIDLAASHVAIINHSNIVGKPLAAMLLARDATVTVCHKFTADVAALSREADVVVTGTGIPGFLTPDYIKAGATVIDVGISRLDDGRIVGDADERIWEKAGAVTPVPGGVGPMTIAMLLANTVQAWNS